jgi:NAD+ kinase
VVDSADRVYEMVVADAREQTPVVLDGRVLCSVAPGDRVRVQRADVQFRLVTAPGHTYYRTLRVKLGWGGRLRKDRPGA